MDKSTILRSSNILSYGSTRSECRINLISRRKTILLGQTFADRRSRAPASLRHMRLVSSVIPAPTTVRKLRASSMHFSKSPCSWGWDGGSRKVKSGTF